MAKTISKAPGGVPTKKAPGTLPTKKAPGSSPGGVSVDGPDNK